MELQCRYIVDKKVKYADLYRKVIAGTARINRSSNYSRVVPLIIF